MAAQVEIRPAYDDLRAQRGREGPRRVLEDHEVASRSVSQVPLPSVPEGVRLGGVVAAHVGMAREVQAVVRLERNHPIQPRGIHLLEGALQSRGQSAITAGREERAVRIIGGTLVGVVPSRSGVALRRRGDVHAIDNQRPRRSRVRIPHSQPRHDRQVQHRHGLRRDVVEEFADHRRRQTIILDLAGSLPRPSGGVVGGEFVGVDANAHEDDDAVRY